MKLADYLRELRDNSFPYPRLGKSAINNASEEQLQQWLLERKQSIGKKASLAELRFALTRFEQSMKPMTQRDIAEKAEVSSFLVNKVFTAGRSIRVSGLKSILNALGYSSSSKEGRMALTLWASESGVTIGVEDVEDMVSEKQSELSAWWRKVSPHLVKMSVEQRETISTAITRPTVVAALPALNAIYDREK